MQIDGGDDGKFLNDLVVDGMNLIFIIEMGLDAFLGGLSFFKGCEIAYRVEIITILNWFLYVVCFHLASFFNVSYALFDKFIYIYFPRLKIFSF